MTRTVYTQTNHKTRELTTLTPLLLTCGDADSYLGLSHGTIRAAIRRGEIIGYRLPGKRNYHVLASELEPWIKQFWKRSDNDNVQTEISRLQAT